MPTIDKSPARVICPNCGAFTTPHCDPIRGKYCGWRVCPRPTCRTVVGTGGRSYKPEAKSGA